MMKAVRIAKIILLSMYFPILFSFTVKYFTKMLPLHFDNGTIFVK